MELDHNYWGRPEDMEAAGVHRPAYVVNATHPGADMAGMTAAGLASASLVSLLAPAIGMGCVPGRCCKPYAMGVMGVVVEVDRVADLPAALKLADGKVRARRTGREDWWRIPRHTCWQAAMDGDCPESSTLRVKLLDQHQLPSIGSTLHVPGCWLCQHLLSTCHCKAAPAEPGTFVAGAEKQQPKAGQGSAEARQAALGLWGQVPGQLHAERARHRSCLPLLGV